MKNCYICRKNINKEKNDNGYNPTLNRIMILAVCLTSTAGILLNGLFKNNHIYKMLLSAFWYSTLSILYRYTIYKRGKDRGTAFTTLLILTMLDALMMLVFPPLGKLYYSFNITTHNVTMSSLYSKENFHEYYSSGMIVSIAIIVGLHCILLIIIKIIDIVRKFLERDDKAYGIAMLVLGGSIILIHIILCIAFPHTILITLTILISITDIVLLHVYAEEHNIKMCGISYIVQFVSIILYYPIGKIISYAYLQSYTISQCFNYGSLCVYLYILSICCMIGCMHWIHTRWEKCYKNERASI